MPSIFTAKDRENIRTKLLSGGERMLLERGITKMNLETLAHSCAIAKGTFYRFFPSKQRFVLAIIRRYQHSRYEQLRAMAEEKKASLTVREAVQVYFSLYKPENNPMLRLRSSDLDWIVKKIPPQEFFDPELDLLTCRTLMSCIRHLRQDIDCKIVSNFARMVVFTLMHKDYIHQDVFAANAEMIIKMLEGYLVETDPSLQHQEESI